MLSFTQTDDLSKYVLAIVAHPPTTAQTEVLDELREKKYQWQQTIDNLARPVVRPIWPQGCAPWDRANVSDVTSEPGTFQ
jgi:hypothetical protein